MAVTVTVNDHDDWFVINDVLLNVAPEQISITKESFNHQWQTLRTTTSQKTKSGHATITINVSIPFVGLDDINDKLRPLIAQLRYYPFCYVENQYIRENLFPQENNKRDDGTFAVTRSTIILATKSISIQTREGEPETLYVNIQFAYFNFLPYTPMWQYKEDLFSNDATKTVSSPLFSKAWKQFVSGAIRKTHAVSSLGSDLEIEFLELRTLPKGKVEDLQTAQQVLQALGENPRPFFDYLRTNVGDNPQATVEDAVRSQLPGFNNLNSLAGTDIILPFLIDSSPKFNPNSARSKGIDGYHVNQQKLQDAIQILQQRIEERQVQERNSEETNGQGFEEVTELSGTDNNGNGFAVFKKIRSLKISKENDMVVTGCTIEINNVLAALPLLSHRYATFQHIGSIDAFVTLNIMLTSDKAVQMINWFYDTVNDNMLNNRHIPQGMQTIHIENPLLTLLGIKEFITCDMRVDTMPGLPGTSQVMLELVESGLKSGDKLDNPEEKFQVEFLSSDPAIIQTLIKVLNGYLRYNLRSKAYELEPATGSNYNARFVDIVTNQYLSSAKSIVEHHIRKKIENQASSSNNIMDASQIANYRTQVYAQGRMIVDPRFGSELGPEIQGLNVFLDEVEDLLEEDSSDNALLTQVLFGMTDDDVPGISVIQEGIYERFRRKNSNITPGISALIGQPIDKLQQASRSSVLTKSQSEAVETQRDLFRKFNFGDNEIDKFQPLENSKSFSLAGGSLAAATFQGISNPTGTLREAQFRDLLAQSVETLLSSAPFIKWSEYIANLTQDIIETEDIDLPEFTEVRKLVDTKALRTGRPAYPDFRFEEILNDEQNKNPNILLSMEPDMFLVTPVGGNIKNFIDGSLISQAKQFAQSSADEAVKQVRNYFDNSWLPKSLSDRLEKKIRLNIDSSLDKHGTDKKEPAFPGKGINQYYSSLEKFPNFYNAASQTGGHKAVEVETFQYSNQITSSEKEDKKGIKSQSAICQSLNPKFLFEPTAVLTSASQNTTSRDPRNKHIHITPLDSGTATSTPVPNAVGLGFAGGQQLWAPLNGELRIAGNGKAIIGAPRVSPTGRAHLHQGVDYLANVGDPVFAIADGIITFIGTGSEAGFQVAITHKDGSRTHCSHLVELQQAGHRRYIISTENGISYLEGGKTKVTAGQLIGFVGRTGLPNPGLGRPQVPTHLHIQCRDGTGQLVPIYDFLPSTQSNGVKTKPVALHGAKNGPEFNASAGVSVLDRSLDEFSKGIQNGQALRLVRAFPTFKLYFIQDDSNNRRRFGLDDFFSYNAVSDITVVRSRKIAADLCEITLTNVSGVLSNRKFQHGRLMNRDKTDTHDVSQSAIGTTGQHLAQDPNNFVNRDTKDENPLASFMINPGVDVELRLGFSNDPDRLTTVFNGKIMEVEFSESDDMVRIICQSYAVELVQDIKGMAEPIEKGGWFINDARTDKVLENMISEPETIHFGRWTRSLYQKDGNTNRDQLTDKWRLSPTPQDDNIFVPPAEELRKYDDGWIINTLKYFIYQTTIWDIFDEMTLRHPGWIKSAVPYKGKYGPRMTMFFGIPSQLYFAADPSVDERKAANRLKQAVDSKVKTIDQLKDITANPNLKNLETSRISTAELIGLTEQNYDERRLALAQDYQSIKPFRAYHLVTSKHHIISNNIRASSKDVYNTISVQHGAAEWNSEVKQLVQEKFDVLTLPIDAALPDEDIRELFVQYSNCQHEFMARKYAVSILIRELKDIYKGELVIIGNPNVKPYDLVYVMDTYSDILGPIEVEQVIHRFSQETGFITEITPDMFVTANEWVNMTAMEYMGHIAESAFGFLNATTVSDSASFGGTQLGLTVGAAMLATVSAPAALLATGLAIGGSWLTKKLVDFTSHGQPVVMHPLIHRGRPLVAGLPLQKLNNLWDVDKGKWVKEGIEGIKLKLDDFQDKLTLAPSTGKFRNLFSGSRIKPKF